MILNVDEFLPYLEDINWSEEKKIEYITDIWNFLDAFFTYDLPRRAANDSASQNAADAGSHVDFDLRLEPGWLESVELSEKFLQCANDNEPPHQKKKGKGHG